MYHKIIIYNPTKNNAELWFHEMGHAGTKKQKIETHILD